MVVVTKVKLKRFKKFKDAEIKLKPGLSLIAGSNNSGKSSVLHALAIWEFCKRILVIEKRDELFHAHSGVGVSFEDFTPLNVPSYKHLWTNLKSQKMKNDGDGYTLRIRVFWNTDKDSTKEYYLEFGLSLANDRLFIKPTDTNLPKDDRITVSVPTFGYLPPFAGITDKEPKYTPAMRRRLLGQGLSGAVIRNIILEMYEENQEKRAELKGEKKKLPTKALKELRETDPYELLQRTIQEVFRKRLKVYPFNEEYHTYIRIESFAGKFNEKGIFRRFPNYNSRDIMVEGSGFLQWLSVYTLALSEEIDVLLLDEADAHLHPSLQTALIKKLEDIAELKDKQVLFATHSSEIIKATTPEQILHIKDSPNGYLNVEEQKIDLLYGIGSTYAPKLYDLQHKKKLLFVESEFDERLLKIWAGILAIEWPQNLTVWHSPAGYKERKTLFLQLKKEIPDLTALSLRDRDDESIGSVKVNLDDKVHSGAVKDLKNKKWKRRTIENYLLCKSAIARAAYREIADIESFFTNNHGLSIPETADSVIHDVIPAIADARAKEIFMEATNSVKREFGLRREDVARAMKADEIPEDVKLLIREIINMCEESS